VLAAGGELLGPHAHNSNAIAAMVCFMGAPLV